MPSLDAARAEALSSNREMLGERLLHGGAIGPRQIEIADESGKVLATVTTQDVLTHDGQFRDFTDDVTQSAPVAEPDAAETEVRPTQKNLAAE